MRRQNSRFQTIIHSLNFLLTLSAFHPVSHNFFPEIYFVSKVHKGGSKSLMVMPTQGVLP